VGRAMLAPLFRRMAALTTQQPLRQIAAPGHAFRSSLELAFGQSPPPGANERPPANGERDSRYHQNANHKQADPQDFSGPLRHTFTSQFERVRKAGSAL